MEANFDKNLSSVNGVSQNAYLAHFLTLFILYTLISTVGFNSLFLFAIIKTRKFSAYALLACLCAINLFTGLVLVPFSLATHLYPYLLSELNPVGKVSCQIFGFFLAFHHRVSIQGFCLLQIERLLVLSKPITRNKRREKLIAFIAATINVLTSMFFATLPFMINTGEAKLIVYEKMPSTPICIFMGSLSTNTSNSSMKSLLMVDTSEYVAVWLIVFTCCLRMLRIACAVRITPARLGTFSRSQDQELTMRSSIYLEIVTRNKRSSSEMFQEACDIPDFCTKLAPQKSSEAVSSRDDTINSKVNCLELNHLSSESSNSIISSFDRWKTEKKFNTKALGTLTATFIIFTLLFIPVVGIKLIFFECQFFKEMPKNHQSFEIAAFIAMFLDFSLHPLLNVAADKHLKATITKKFKNLIFNYTTKIKEDHVTTKQQFQCMLHRSKRNTQVSHV